MMKKLIVSGIHSSRSPLQAVSSNASLYGSPSLREEFKTASRTSLEVQQTLTALPPCITRAHNDTGNEIAALTHLEHVKDEIHSFEQACRLWAENYHITKIAHGSYAAIFRLQLRLDTSKYVIAKLMPLKPKAGKGSRAMDQTSIDDAATEVKALDAMSEIPGFVGFSEAWVLKGALPSVFEEQYKDWARIHPEDGFTGYSKEQLWCFIEMSDAGIDLEQVLQNRASKKQLLRDSGDEKGLTAVQCWDIFWGIAEALGRGEEFSEFEHRDLHPGNVCIKNSDFTSNTMNEPPLRKKYTTLEVTLIDYTLSRATLPNGEVLANTMKDQSIFDQRIKNPRTKQQYNDNQQYEAYRQMRKLVIHDLLGCKDPGQAWRSFVPRTNVLWLHHILSILLRNTGTHRKNGAREEAFKPRVNKKHQDSKQPHDHLVTTHHAEAAEAKGIWEMLEELQESLGPDRDAGFVWESAKALLESERYWTDEARYHFQKENSHCLLAITGDGAGHARTLSRNLSSSRLR